MDPLNHVILACACYGPKVIPKDGNILKFFSLAEKQLRNGVPNNAEFETLTYSSAEWKSGSLSHPWYVKNKVAHSSL